jgi:hypothetical protein
VTFPAQLVIHEAVLTLDGGPVTILATDEYGRDHAVRLTPRALPSPRASTDEVPGRLYYDGAPVPVRSGFEERVLSLLRSADVTDGGPLGNRVGWLAAVEVVRFVSSDEYPDFAERVEQATDGGRYDLRVRWDDATFWRAVIQTKQLLGLGMREAVDHVEQRRPVATGLRAPEVVEWARRFREADRA